MSVTFISLWIVREFMTICLVWFVSVRHACVVLNFPCGDVVSLHLFNVRCACVLRTLHFGDVKVPHVLIVFPAFSAHLLLHCSLVLCSIPHTEGSV